MNAIYDLVREVWSDFKGRGEKEYASFILPPIGDTSVKGFKCPNCGEVHIDWLGPEDLSYLAADEACCTQCHTTVKNDDITRPVR
jgi:hypothetical protein